MFPYVAVLPALMIGLLLLVGCAGDSASLTPTTGGANGAEMGDDSATGPVLLVLPHFVDSDPSDGDVLAEAPEVLLLNVNFFLRPGSGVSVTRNGEPVPVGEATISDDELAMTVPILGNTGDGVYEVRYNACWPTGACDKGSTRFTVDSSIGG